MNTAGKTLTIFLIIISILFVSLTAITIFFFQKENEMRKTAEAQLAEAQASVTQLQDDLKESKKQAFLFEEKNKEADEKINNLMDEIELAEGLREQLKLENAALQEALTGENEKKEVLRNELSGAQQTVASLKAALKESEEIRVQLAEQVAQMEAQPPSAQQQVALQPIVIAPGDIREGAVVRVDVANDFVIFDLGRQDGIRDGMAFSIFRGSKYLGDITVSRVQANLSVGDFIPPLTSKQVRANDRVVIKE